MAIEEKLLSYCGLVCSACEAYLATQDNDDAQRATVAAAWSKLYQGSFVPQDINCDGCTVENGRHFSHCQSCQIRACARERGVQSCAYCADYACQKLTDFFNLAPGTKETLDALRASR